MGWLEDKLSRWLEGLRVGGGAADSGVPAPAREFSWAMLGEKMPASQWVLHVGCGTARQAHLPGEFKQATWREIRLDGDESVTPDIVASMTDMHVVPDGAVDALFSSHGVEHLYWHDVPVAFGEFFRVLNDEGLLIVTCPDLQSAAEMIAEDKLFEPAYESPAGTITPFDIVYSYRPFVQENPQWMAHHCGYTLSTLVAVMRAAGFVGFYGFRRRGAFDLWVLATKKMRSEDDLCRLADRFLPGQE